MLKPLPRRPVRGWELFVVLTPRAAETEARFGVPCETNYAAYLAALIAGRFRAEWRQRYQRLLARGRAKKEALTILSRSRLLVTYHLLHTGPPMIRLP